MDFATFQKALEPGFQKICASWNDFPWENPEAYRNWAAQTYYYVCHSTRLLSLCAARFTIERDDLHQRFLKHSDEEARHEQLAIRDIVKSGGRGIQDYPQMDETRAFYQVQYHWIEYVNPVAFFGYILALEGMSVKSGPRAFAKAEQAHGKGACAFLKVHAMEDVDHVEEAFKYLKTLSPSELDIVKTNFDQACTLYSNMMHEIATRAGVGFERRAA